MPSFADRVADAWYNNKAWILLLAPLSVIFWFITTVRRALYRRGVFKSTSVDVPVIVIGNITVGGTGKSPLTAFLVEALKEKGFSPGIVSRGYGGKSDRYPLLVTEQSEPAEVGDEPVMLQQITGVPVVVDPVRSSAARHLIDQCDVDVVICDDGLQHYALKRDIEICVLDGERGVGNGYMLPAGPLREPVSRMNNVDFVISNGESERVRKILNRSGLVTQRASGTFEMALTPAALVNVFDGRVKALSSLKGKSVHAVAGIGNPSRFFKTLSGLGAMVTTHSYPDHHHYIKENITFSDNTDIVMTQKDAVKCRSLYAGNEQNSSGVQIGAQTSDRCSNRDTAPDNVWFLPVKAVIDEQFIDQLCDRMATRS